MFNTSECESATLESMPLKTTTFQEQKSKVV